MTEFLTLISRVESLEEQLASLDVNKAESSAKSNSKIKRVSGYLLHNSHYRDQVKSQLQKSCSDTKVKATDVTKELAKMWKDLSDDERTSWNAKASPEKESPVKWVNHDDTGVGAGPKATLSSTLTKHL